jgi:hypothetical protein
MGGSRGDSLAHTLGSHGDHRWIKPPSRERLLNLLSKPEMAVAWKTVANKLHFSKHSGSLSPYNDCRRYRRILDGRLAKDALKFEEANLLSAELGVCRHETAVPETKS